MALSARQSVELFHLIFLRALVAKGEAKGLFALKGGCNLRFFFQSTRYSEDIDTEIDRAMEMSFDDFASQVVAYLETAQAELFSSRSAWETMQASVIERLERLP